VKNPKADSNEPPKNFSFDAVFDENVEQKYIYDICASNVVESVLNGYNGTIFACNFKFLIFKIRLKIFIQSF
jgi:kinesin family protein 3/17